MFVWNLVRSSGLQNEIKVGIRCFQKEIFIAFKMDGLFYGLGYSNYIIKLQPFEITPASHQCALIVAADSVWSS